MGTEWIDQYSLLHLASGIIAYFFGIRLNNWIIIHLLFEYIENTPEGMSFINTYFKGVWPGGKDRSDTTVNTISDTVFAVIGWGIAHYLDRVGSRNKWFAPHLKNTENKDIKK